MKSTWTRSLWRLEAEVMAFKVAVIVVVLVLVLALVPWALRLLDVVVGVCVPIYLSYAKWAAGA